MNKSFVFYLISHLPLLGDQEPDTEEEIVEKGNSRVVIGAAIASSLLVGLTLYYTMRPKSSPVPQTQQG